MDITKQKRIDSLLNASHNSDAEKEYLRKRILEIFQDSEEGKKVLGELDKEDEDASKEGKKGRRNSDPTSKSKGNNQQEFFFCHLPFLTGILSFRLGSVINYL